MLGSIDKGAMCGYNRHGTAGYSPLPITFCKASVDLWLIGGDRRETHRDLAQNSERPGRNMFAQGAMTTIARRRWGLPTKPQESGSAR